MRNVLLLCLLLNVAGCSSFMHGYTSTAAQNQLLMVDKEKESFGYKRLEYIKGYHGAGITAFIDEKGLPDYLYEFSDDGRDCAAFYYIAENRVYLFKEMTWNPSSFAFVGMRELNDFEKKRFNLQESTKISI